MATAAKVKERLAWAIVDRRGAIHLEKIRATQEAAWALLCNEHYDFDNTADAKANGYRCVRVSICAR